ncbi:Structural maintenance of chromosomes protein 6 [Nosema granulosis]|uniref:Structural maintenance of chromosomes protein 6 n=1 Tax=Nosema granulosis TaxID=83296 RepID=A0A9P6H0K9_9MICR|nr:Structural maintenance of chromosomes protein 6 [Nosema granulosis]
MSSSQLFEYNRDVLINSIELVNFMCHDHLIVRFNKKFTCIGGRNGSGKSAIMISLGILFGLRSASLDRGNSLKNLIKTGESFFIVRCVLNNTKKFMYDTFGDFIILEKKVTVKNSTFSVTNKEKKTVFNRVEDLEYLMDFYDLKFDNPMNFLTQEMAKRFLSSSDPKVLYQLFLKGTEIADIRMINEEYKKNVSTMKQRIEAIEKEIENLNTKILNETKRVEILSNVKSLKERIENCKCEIEWSKINKVKLEGEHLFNSIEEMIKETKRKQDEITRILEESHELTREKKELQSDNKALQERNKARLEEIDQEISTKEKTVRSIENDLKELEKNLKYKQDLIQKFELSNTFVDKREDLAEEKKSLDNKLSAMYDEIENIRYAFEKKEKERDTEVENMKAYEKKLFAIRKQIEYFSKNEEGFKLHPKMDTIAREISNTKFEETVHGPIGNYISLKEQRWAKVVSILTQKILTNFICFNQRDREKLHAIFKRHNVPFSVQIPSNKMDKLIEYKSNNNYKTVLDVISVASTVVLNQLIIMLSIERIILIEYREKAYSVMRQSPSNVECVYLPNGDVIKRVGGSLSDFSSKKLERYYFENAIDKKKALQEELKRHLDNKPTSDSTKAYNNLKSKLSDLNSKKDDLQRRASQLDREIENAESLYATQKEMISTENIYEEKTMIDMQISALKKRILKLNNEIKILSDEQRDIKNTVYKSVADLDTQLIEKQAKLNRLNGETNQLIAKKLEIERQYKAKIRDYEELRLLLLEKMKEVENPRDERTVSDELKRLATEVEEINKIGNAVESQAILNELMALKNDKDVFLQEYRTKTEDLYQSFIARVDKREKLKEYISKVAALKFTEITSLRGYLGELIFDHENESLFLKMKVHSHVIAGSKETLSGGERSFAAMSLLLSLWAHVSCPVKVLDEFDVFMDNLNRKFVIEKFKEHFLQARNQVILITPLNTNDLVDDEINIITLKSPERTEI